MLPAWMTAASDFGLGAFNSPKGFGLSFFADRNDRAKEIVEVYADMYSVLSGRHGNPGIKSDYCHAIVIESRPTDWGRWEIYAGPGASLGWVRDNGCDNFGAMVALHGAVGFRMAFDRGIGIDIGFGADLGIHLENANDTVYLKIYRNGLYRLPYPQLTISYRF